MVGYAANAILERAWGKPKEYDPSKDVGGPAVQFDPSKLSPKQLAVVKRALMVLLEASAQTNDQSEQDAP